MAYFDRMGLTQPQEQDTDVDYSMVQPDKFAGNYAQAVTPLCATCQHRDSEDLFRCLAYPKGIPLEILTGEVDHNDKYKGDHGIQFKAVE